ncbi:hypothetical protein ACIRFH_35670 [Streptomyces sp. NPDC093586]|uniref:hypothetical protein n=1 Tax=Streptomyces sp. NPDC093586 TaxID=3366042 RepID=UPI003817D526
MRERTAAHAAAGGRPARPELSAIVQRGLYQGRSRLAAALDLDRPLLAPHGMRYIERALPTLDGHPLHPTAIETSS